MIQTTEPVFDSKHGRNLARLNKYKLGCQFSTRLLGLTLWRQKWRVLTRRNIDSGLRRVCIVSAMSRIARVANPFSYVVLVTSVVTRGNMSD